MDTNKAIITSDTMNERRWLTNIKKFFKIFIKQSKPASKELIELQTSEDEEIPDFLPPDPNNIREFETGEEMWQYAKEIGSKLQPKVRPNRNR